jgi:hypothetical protein
MKELARVHSGSNLSSTLLETVLEWGIKHKVGYFQADNAGNNDTLCQNLETRKLQLFSLNF